MSIITHAFIPQLCWEKSKQAMKDEYLPSSETYVFIKDKIIKVFIALVVDYLTTIFIMPQSRGSS